MMQPRLFDDALPDPTPPDQAARDYAVDPLNDVVLEASAGTGKTRVLVGRYVRLVEEGVHPRHILAMTFTRKAAAEMRERVLATLRARAASQVAGGPAGAAVARASEIAISTLDAFCFGLLREFPLEAGVDPAFQVADETEMARFSAEAVEAALRWARTRLAADEALCLLFARVKPWALRDALATLVDRRHVAGPAIATFLKRAGPARTAAEVAAAFLERVSAGLGGAEGGGLLDDGPMESPEFVRLRADLISLDRLDASDGVAVQALRRRVERYFLTQKGEPRKRVIGSVKADHFAPGAKRRHEAALSAIAPRMRDALDRLDIEADCILARGLDRLCRTAWRQYESLLADHSLLDFAGMLRASVTLLTRQEEFARSRLKLQSRYHHLLIDEFQDTSREQWRLIGLLVDAWGEGAGVADAPTSIFVVGDRKQSIYRFRHAEATLLDEAAQRIGGLKGRPAVRAISASFRAVPALLSFVNALAASLETPQAPDPFRYADDDRFPVPRALDGGRHEGVPVVGLAVGESMAEAADVVASEVQRLLETGRVRSDRGARSVRPEDIAVLFRARSGHQFFEEALEQRGIRTYVYKGLGFFDTPEVRDLQVLLQYLAQPDSDIAAAALLRSRWFRLSDVALTALAPGFAAALRGSDLAFQHDPARADDLVRPDEQDRQHARDHVETQDLTPELNRARSAVAAWLAAADRMPASELLDLAIRSSAYAAELAGRRFEQARENVKKVRALVRRVESRGYANLARLARFFDTLRAGDESNAIVAAAGAVNLMTIHAAKGLEFPIVFVVNLQSPARGRSEGITVTDRGPNGEPAVGIITSEAAALEEAREEEEAKRLLYVAATRARDRLYFSAVLERGRLPARPRSLAGLLPASLASAFEDAGRLDQEATRWASPEGEFALTVCRASVVGPTGPAEEPASQPVDLRPLTAVPAPPVGVSTWIASAAPAAGSAEVTAPRAIVGSLVHRLFQHFRGRPAPPEALAPLAWSLVKDHERADVTDAGRVVRAATEAYERVTANQELRRLLDDSTSHFEVGISFRPDAAGPVLRGTLDCLILHGDGRLTVVDIKTGVPRPEHGRQVEIYAQAAGLAFGVRDVSTKIVYVGG